MNSETATDTVTDKQAGLDVAIDQAQTGAPEDYLPVDVGLLRAGPERGFDLYQRMDRQMVLFCAHSYPLRNKALRRLHQEDVQTIYVPLDQGPLISQYVESILLEVVQDEKIAVERRARVLRTSARTIMADIQTDPMSHDMLRRGTALANATVDFVSKDPAAVKALVAVFAKDYYTYTHCVHTCVLGVALYKYLISPKPAMLRRFGLGMLLHDAGKSLIDSKALNKPTRLTPEEFEHVKRHPQLGWSIVSGHGAEDELIRQPVLHHHEKLDGSGYPEGLSGSQIGDAARVAAIVDVYDALTCSRAYRPALTDDQAVKIMTEQMTPSHLDGEMLATFCRARRSFGLC